MVNKTNNSIQYLTFVCTQVTLSSIISSQLAISYTNSFICWQLKSFKYCYLIIQFDINYLIVHNREKKTIWELHQNASSYFEIILEGTPHETIVVRPLTSLQKNIQVNEQDMWDTTEEARTNSLMSFSCGPVHMDVPVLAN